jgi:hypothetical protein
MRFIYSAKQTAFTLIELLLYIAIMGSLLISVTLYFAMTADSRVKNQSISEVNQQGAAIMDRITQTVRNASAITTPATTVCSNSLSVTVPTGVLSPTVFTTNSSGGSTVLGYNGTGTNTDSQNSGFIHASRFTAATSGIITTLNARVATVSASPNNKAQMALYSGTTPTTLLATSGEIALTANAFNTFCIPPVSITAGTTYWLAYNTNGLTVNDNDLRYRAGSSGQARFVAQAYGTWPASFAGTTSAAEFSVYTDIYTGTGSGTIRVQEGSGSVTDLANNKVQVSGFAVYNLTRTGTPGTLRFSFVVSRVNPNNKNQFEYQRAFTGSASLRWP